MWRFSLLSLLTLAACSTIPPEAYFARGTPESLLDASSEQITIDVSDYNGLNQLTEWVNRNQPSRAELQCADRAKMCEKARDVFEQFSVPVTVKPGSRAVAVLMYERIQARDCENRYIDNTINPYNLNHPTFGCSIAANSVQQISDRKQLLNPGLLDNMDGKKAVEGYDRYNVTKPEEDFGKEGVLEKNK